MPYRRSTAQLKGIRKELELSVFGAEKPAPKAFDPMKDTLPAEVDALFDKAVKAAQSENFEELLAVSQKIEAYFGFPAPNELVQKAEIPGAACILTWWLSSSSSSRRIFFPVPWSLSPRCVWLQVCRLW